MIAEYQVKLLTGTYADVLLLYRRYVTGLY